MQWLLWREVLSGQYGDSFEMHRELAASKKEPFGQAGGLISAQSPFSSFAPSGHLGPLPAAQVSPLNRSSSGQIGGLLGNADVTVQQISRATAGRVWKGAVVAFQDSTTDAGRGRGGNAETISVPIGRIRKRFEVRDTLATIPHASIGADWNPEDAGLTVKFSARGTALDISRSLVGGGHDVVESVVS